VAIAHYYFCLVTVGVAPLLFAANRDRGSAAIFKVAIAHLCFWYSWISLLIMEHAMRLKRSFLNSSNNL